MSNSLKTLISKLNTTCRQAAERAASLCLSRGNYEVDLEHLLMAILENQGADLMVIARRCGISPTGLERELEQEVSRFKNGNTRTPVFSTHILKLLEQAWLIASLDARLPRIRSGHLLLALLTEPELSQLAFRGSKLLAKVRLDELKHNFDKMTEGSAEAAEVAGLAAPVDGGDDTDPLLAGGPQSGKTPALDQFTTNLTQRARDGKVDPVIGRDSEIRQVIDILMRRRQNNPILTGEAGVGKTAVVEGFAQKIVAGDVPPPLQDVTLRTLDVGLLQAGASMKGEFEQRLRQVIDEVQASPQPKLLFIDEAHTLIGAGGAAGTGDAANLLKPALARGKLRTIATTTWAEYKKYFEKDPALTRRFQVVQVDEPDEARGIQMLRGVVPVLEKHHKVDIQAAAVDAAVKLSHRYIPARQLPDKAVSLLDSACARDAVSLHATPAEVDDCRRRIEALETEQGIIAREAAIGIETTERAATVAAALATERERLEALQSRWDAEKTLVDRLLALRAELRAASV